MNKVIIILSLFVNFIGCSPIVLQMKPYEKATKIQMNKSELMAHIRYVASNYFVSAKTVTDNIDTASGIIHFDFIINMADKWGIPLLGSKAVMEDRFIDVKFNVFVKDSAFKIESASFKPRSQNMVDTYVIGAGKTQEDFDTLQQKTVDDFTALIMKEQGQLNMKWDF